MPDQLAAESPIRNTGDLFTRCRRRWGLTPEEVRGILGVPADTEPSDYRRALGDLDKAYRDLESVLEMRSGRVLRAEAGLLPALDEAEQKAWQALARYKFQMFGYWVSIWVHLNRLSGLRRPNPFTVAVALAQAKIKSRETHR